MTSLDLAIAYFEKQRNEKVFSIRLIEGPHQNDSYLINMSTLVQIASKDPLAIPMGIENPEWDFYRVRAENDFPAPYPHFYAFNQARHRIEPFIFGDQPFESPDKKEKEALEIVSALSFFHQLPYVVKPYPLLERFRFFKARCDSTLPASFENRILTKVDHLRNPSQFCLCHHQLKSGHIIMSENGPIFLDFEMAGMDCPLLDLASLVEENDFDSPLARKCLAHFNSLHPNVTYSFEDLETLVTFWDAYWYYRHMAYHKISEEPIDEERAKHKKERFLFAFEASLMGDGE